MFYKQFSNELTLVLLDIHDSWGKIGIISVTCRTGIISAIYKRDDKIDITTSNAYDNVTDFKICGFHKNTKI